MRYDEFVSLSTALSDPFFPINKFVMLAAVLSDGTIRSYHTFNVYFYLLQYLSDTNDGVITIDLEYKGIESSTNFACKVSFNGNTVIERVVGKEYRNGDIPPVLL